MCGEYCPKKKSPKNSLSSWWFHLSFFLSSFFLLLLVCSRRGSIMVSVSSESSSHTRYCCMSWRPGRSGSSTVRDQPAALTGGIQFTATSRNLLSSYHRIQDALIRSRSHEADFLCRCHHFSWSRSWRTVWWSLPRFFQDRTSPRFVAVSSICGPLSALRCAWLASWPAKNSIFPVFSGVRPIFKHSLKLLTFVSFLEFHKFCKVCSCTQEIFLPNFWGWT